MTSPSFLDCARTYLATSSVEPRLSLALAAYTRTRPVHVVSMNGEVVDLGTL
jgi:hypothetical protein